MRLLVIGRSGQLARSLAVRSEACGWLDVISAGRPQLDLAIPGSAERLIRHHRPDAIINAAAFTAVDQAEGEAAAAFRLNAEAPGEIAQAAAAVGAPLIHISTDYVFDGRGSRAYAEVDPTAPLGVYGRSKLDGEQRVAAASGRHVIVRTSWLVSPYGRNFVRTMMDAAGRGNALRVVADQHGSPTSALDLADGLLAFLGRWAEGDRVGEGETYHLANRGVTSWHGLAAFVMDRCRTLGLPWADVEPIATADWPTEAERPPYSALDSRKFLRDVGFAMPTWEDGVERVVAQIARERLTA